MIINKKLMIKELVISVQRLKIFKIKKLNCRKIRNLN